MAAKHLCLLMLAVVAFGAVSAQSDDDPIPVENDNQFPPDNQAEADDDGGTIQGSGDGMIQEPEEPTSTTTESLQVPLEEMQPTNQLLAEGEKSASEEPLCPDKCLCSFEDVDFVTDCSGQELTEFPVDIDSKTTKLKIQNNKLTEIPKEISTLQSLKFLNASSNSITDLAHGSISELHELAILDLNNNRLIEYPNDLKNSFSLTKLEELHLGGNDMRTPFGSDTFVMLKSLGKITVPSSAYEEQLEDTLCKSLKESLRILCVEACYIQELVCPEGPDEIDNEKELNFQIPGAIFSDKNDDEDDVDPTLSSINAYDMDTEIKSGDNETLFSLDNSTNDLKEASDTNINSASDVSLRNDDTNETEVSPENGDKSYDIASTQLKEPFGISRFNAFKEVANEEPTETEPAAVPKVNTAVVDAPNEESEKNNADYKTGSKTDSKTLESQGGGGVSKSVIGMVVAGMVVIIAVITIKKNWSSIRKKFSSNSRTPNDRPAGNANGTTPEEVPLQDKSPV